MRQSGDSLVIGILASHKELDRVELCIESHQPDEDGIDVVALDWQTATGTEHAAIVPEPPLTRKMTETDYGRCGTGAGAKASLTTRSTFSRFPSTTGWSPPSSRRASSTRPCARTVRKPKSERKSRGKIVLWT
jgi:hypothetical protein